MAQGYRVCAPYVTVTLLDDAGGETVRGFYEGGILPDNAKRESVKLLVEKGMVESTDDAPEPEDLEPAKQDTIGNADGDLKGDEDEDDEEKAKAEAKGETKATNRPRVNASKEEWVTYAVSQREDGTPEADARAELEGWSKNDLITEYGG